MAGPVFAGAVQVTDRLVVLLATEDTEGAAGRPGGSGATALVTAVAATTRLPLPAASVEWQSPLREQEFKEYRDHAALTLAGVQPLRRPLADFWPTRGPVWDAIGVRSREGALFLEAKAHIPETASPPSRASTASAALISRSLAEALRWYSSGASAPWDRLFYQYANRLAHHFFLRRVNRIDAALVFLYFVNADDVHRPKSELEWRGAVRLIHAVLGLPEHLGYLGVYDAFVDVRRLKEAL